MLDAKERKVKQARLAKMGRAVPPGGVGAGGRGSIPPQKPQTPPQNVGAKPAPGGGVGPGVMPPGGRGVVSPGAVWPGGPMRPPPAPPAASLAPQMRPKPAGQVMPGVIQPQQPIRAEAQRNAVANMMRRGGRF